MKTYNFKFIKNSRKFAVLSIVLILISILSSFVFGAKLDIQFKGGTIITYLYDGEIDADAFKADAAEALGGTDVSVAQGQDLATGKNNIRVSLLSNSGVTAEDQISLTNTLEEKYSDNALELGESTTVSPSAGKEFFSKCLVATAFSAIVLIIYIAVRFKTTGGWIAGACAIIALFHDIIIVYGTFVICGMGIDANFMAVVLTILGYSVNDTIVIYDRIRENEALYRNKNMSHADLTDLSINQSLTRSLRTSVTTISAMLIVTVVAYIYGVTSIISFSFPMMIGLISGTYSSLCVAGPLWIWIESKTKKEKDSPKAKVQTAKE